MIARSKCEKILTGHFQVYLQYSIHLFTFIQKQLDNFKFRLLIVLIVFVVLKRNKYIWRLYLTIQGLVELYG